MRNLLQIVLVNPEIPHNTGAIGRLCVGLDCPLHLIRPLGFDLNEKYVKRAGLDYWGHLDLKVHASWDDFLKTTGEDSEMHFLSTHGTKSLYDCAFHPGSILVFGSESSGLPRKMYEKYKKSLLKIPMPGEFARSINLANSVSIAAYEAYRQIATTPANEHPFIF